MTPASPDDAPLIAVVDDDDHVRESLGDLLESQGFRVRGFAALGELEAARTEVPPACLVLDVRLRGASGLEYHKKIAGRDDAPPVILMSGHADVPMCVEAMKAGAVDFLTKPFRDQTFIDAVTAAMRLGDDRRRATDAARALGDRYARLSPRERQVMALVTAGRLNKQVAGDLSISEVTIKLHRGSAMRKMGARSFADLVRMAGALGLAADRAGPSQVSAR